MTQSTLKQKNKKHVGQSLVEIFVAMSIFTVAIGGLFMATNASKQNLAKSMKIDIEAQYAQLLTNEVNVNNIDVETVYDETSKQSISLPNGNTVYYTRLVDSAFDSADVKNISVYFFKSSTDTTPYRKFTTEVALKSALYHWCDTSDPLCISSGFNYLGQHVISSDDGSASFVSTAGSYKAGSLGGTVGFSSAASVAGDFSNSLFKSGIKANTIGATPNDIVIQVPASKDVSYKITLYLAEQKVTQTVGCRTFDVLINNTLVENELDVFDEVGINTLLTKTYTTTPILISGLYVNKIHLDATNAGCDVARLNGLKIERGL